MRSWNSQATVCFVTSFHEQIEEVGYKNLWIKISLTHEKYLKLIVAVSFLHSVFLRNSLEQDQGMVSNVISESKGQSETSKICLMFGLIYHIWLLTCLKQNVTHPLKRPRSSGQVTQSVSPTECLHGSNVTNSTHFYWILSTKDPNKCNTKLKQQYLVSLSISKGYKMSWFPI